VSPCQPPAIAKRGAGAFDVENAAAWWSFAQQAMRSSLVCPPSLESLWARHVAVLGGVLVFVSAV
jgi:hypothetical protein